jgi:hypothetical protein
VRRREQLHDGTIWHMGDDTLYGLAGGDTLIGD